ncbi:hypothetical protein FACS1894200_07500 [Spirochaetia bacterium]|nr:hypothetical protein FACS1894200_07500 [Spirochaetia bacterium]
MVILKREIMLVKISADEAKRSTVIQVANIFRSRVIDVSPTTITIEASGDLKKLDGLVLLLQHLP